MAIFCQSGPTPAVRTASVASSRGVGSLIRSVIPWPAAISASSAVSIGGPGRDDPGRHQAPPERLTEPALVVVTGLHADRRRVEADEQQPVATRRQVGEGLDRRPVDLDGRPVRAGSGPAGQGVEVVGSSAGGRRRAGRRGARLRSAVVAGVGGGAESPLARAWISAWALVASILASFTPSAEGLAELREVFGPRQMTTSDEHDDEDQQDVHAAMVQRAGSAWPSGDRDDQPERGVGRRERRDLVVDQAGGSGRRP